jgi:hypothetical protein
MHALRPSAWANSACMHAVQRCPDPEMPMTMAGVGLPSLRMHQLPSSARSRASSRRSCCRMGTRRRRSSRHTAMSPCRPWHPAGLTCDVYLNQQDELSSPDTSTQLAGTLMIHIGGICMTNWWNGSAHPPSCC